MNITYVCQRVPPAQLTGSERYINDLAKFIGEKYIVDVIANGQSLNKPTEPTYHNINFKTFKEFPVRVLTAPLRMGLTRLNRQWLLDLYSKPFNGFMHSTSWGFFSLSMKNYLQSNKFDLVHSTAVPTATAWLSWRICRKKKVPFVFTPFLHYELIDFKVPWVKSLLLESSAVIAVTNKEKQKLIEFGVNAPKIHVIPLGIDYRMYKKKDLNSFYDTNGLNEDLFVILIPRKSREKGTYDTLRAIVNLSKKYNKLALILLDKISKKDESIMNAFKQTITSNGVKVVDLGFVSGEKLIEAYQASDVVVEPSSVDSFGIVFLEAWASGKPVVAADFGAISEVVLNGLNGLLVKFGDWEGIEKALISLIEDNELKIKLGENGKRDVIKKYSIQNMGRKTEHLYELVTECPRID